jgi:hypothetical protein
MATTTVNHLNVELAAEVSREIAGISAALSASAEKPSAKIFRTGMEFHEYVAKAPGVSFWVRLQMKRAFKADNAGIALRKIIDETPDHHFSAGVRGILSDYWDRNFKR